MRIQFVRPLLLLAPAIFLLGHRASASDAWESIKRIWHNRATEWKSGQFEWEENCTFHKAYFSRYSQSAQDSNALPAKEATVTHRYKLMFSGQRFIHTFAGRIWDSNAREFNETVNGFSFDGTTLGRLHGTVGELIRTDSSHSKFSGTRRPLAFLQSNDKEFVQDAFRNFHLYPATLTYRFLDEVVSGIPTDDLSFDDEMASLDEKTLVVIRHNHPAYSGPNRRYSYWIDLEQMAALRRILFTINSKVVFQQDFRYRSLDVSDVGLVAEGWRGIDASESGEPEMTYTATMIKFDKNPQLSEDDFTLPLPLGTLVTDSTLGPNQTRQYIIREGGANREILKEEEGMPYATLVRTNAGDTAPADNATWSPIKRRILVLNGLAVIIGLALWLGWRTIRTRNG